MIRIGTRQSKLAMIQTEIVKGAILKAFPDEMIEVVPIITEGDKVLDKSLASFGGKGVFTRELEDALENGVIDLAVHSAKDMPMEFPEGLTVGAVISREDPRDVLITRSGVKAALLPGGSVIGTSSLRREIQIKNMNPEVRIKVLRGNVLTRLDKLRQGLYDGIILAAAGLKRLGIEEGHGLYFEYMDTELFVPAAGQGILAVEIRKGDLAEVMGAIHSVTAAAALTAERHFLALLGGSCNAPCGAYCRESESGVRMTAMYARDGRQPVMESMVMENQKGASLELARRLAGKLGIQKVSLVGAGPGDKGLLSRKGLLCVRKADVIIFDNLISPSILNEAGDEAELIYAGKRSSHHHLSQDEINQVMAHKALDGRYVVRLKGGDPYIFGRGGEEAMALSLMGIPYEIVPGVSSAYSVPAYAGIPVTQRRMASSFHVITGHEGSHKDAPVLDYHVLAQEEGTLVFLMGLHNLEKIAGALMSNGKKESTPAAVIEKGATAGQRMVAGTLGNIARKAREGGIETPAVAVIGDVVSLHEQLAWFGQGPLAGQRILLTGTRHMVGQLEKSLDNLGAETVAISLIRTKACITERYLDAVRRIEKYQWIVFTSGNGVKLFFESLKKEGIDYRRIMKVKFAAVGSGSAEALEECGFYSDFIPSCYTVFNLAKEWVPTLQGNEKVLLLRAKESSDVILQELDGAGIEADDIKLYETCCDERRRGELNRIVKDMDYVVTASSSGVRALKGMLEDRSAVNKLVAIGPVTAKEAEAEGFAVHMTACTYNAEGIAAAILADSRKISGKQEENQHG